MSPQWFSDQVTALRLSFIDSSLPGLKVICGFGSPLRRLAWLLVFLTLFALTISDIVNLALEYYNYPDSLNIKYEEPAGGEHMPMPAITVCNLNPYKWVEFCAELELLFDMSRELMANQTSYGIERMKKVYCSSGSQGEIRLSVRNLTIEYIQLMHYFIDLSRVLQRNPPSSTKMVQVSHSLKDMIELASFNNECNIFPGDGNNTSCSISLTMPVSKMYPRYGQCFCFFCSYTTNKSNVVRMQKFDGPHNGLLLVLRVEDKSYLPFFAEAGFIIAVHDQGIEVDFTKDGVFIQPLTTTYIGVSRRTLRRLSESYQNPCRHDWPPNLKRYVRGSSKYTALECRAVCHQYVIQKRLRCTSLKYPTLYVKNRSEPSGYSDVRLKTCRSQMEAPIIDIEKEIQSRTIECDCKNVCDETNFDKTVSSLSWHPIIQADSIKNLNATLKAKVYVYMQSNMINSRTKVEKMSSREFVSGIGSIMGIYLGYSFLFCWNILDVLGRAIVKTYHAYHEQKVRTPKALLCKNERSNKKLES